VHLPASGRSEAQVAADTAASTKVKLACQLNSAQCHLKLADLAAAVKARLYVDSRCVLPQP